MSLRSKWVRSILTSLVALAVLLPAGAALANPWVPTAMVALDGSASRQTRTFYMAEAPEVAPAKARPTRLTLVKYQRPLEVRGHDMRFKFRAPGKKKSLVHFEVKF